MNMHVHLLAIKLFLFRLRLYESRFLLPLILIHNFAHQSEDITHHPAVINSRHRLPRLPHRLMYHLSLSFYILPLVSHSVHPAPDDAVKYQNGQEDIPRIFGMEDNRYGVHQSKTEA